MSHRKPDRAPSVMQTEEECYITRKWYNAYYGPRERLHLHHIFFGNKNRCNCDKYGFWCYLRPQYHNKSNMAVHCKDGKALDEELKRDCQMAYEALGHSRDEFFAITGENYL